MVSFEQAVSNQLCDIKEELKKIRLLNETWEKRETTGIVFFTIPEAGDTRSFAVGTTKINFRTGVITNPDNTNERMTRKLDQFVQEDGWLHSISIDADQNIKLKILPNSTRTIDANFSTQIPYLNYYEVEITCTVTTKIKIFACTNPSAVIGQFKGPADMTQTNITGDTTEDQTWDSVNSLLNNLNRIRKKLNDIIGGTLWSGAVPASLTTLNNKFDVSTGHDHDGVNSKLLNSANLLASITPTFSGWNTNPGTNANLTDELTTTLTTNGALTDPGTATIIFDLGATKRIIFMVSAGYTQNITNGLIYIDMSTDGSTYIRQGTISGNELNGDNINANNIGARTIISNARYAKITFKTGGTSLTWQKINIRAYRI